MKKQIILSIFIITALAGCTNNSALSGNTVSASQAQRMQNVIYGIVLSTHPVTIQGGNDNNIVGAIAGGVLGGLVGNAVGGGSGRKIATAGGAILGGLAGQSAESAMNRADGVQLEIRRDDGSVVSIVQPVSSTQFFTGQRVMIITNGSTATVEPANS